MSLYVTDKESNIKINSFIMDFMHKFVYYYRKPLVIFLFAFINLRW